MKLPKPNNIQAEKYVAGMSLFKKKWLIVVEEEAAKNSEFKRVWSSLKTFRENYSIWHDLGYVN